MRARWPGCERDAKALASAAKPDEPKGDLSEQIVIARTALVKLLFQFNRLSRGFL